MSERDTPAPRRIPDALKFANGLLRQRKYELAAEEYERFLKSSPAGTDGADARFGFANARLYQGRYQDARAGFDDYLKDAAHDDPRRVTARYRLGELSYLVGDLRGRAAGARGFYGDEGPAPRIRDSVDVPGRHLLWAARLAQRLKAYERSLADYPQGRLADPRSTDSEGRWLPGRARPSDHRTARARPAREDPTGSIGLGCRSA